MGMDRLYDSIKKALNSHGWAPHMGTPRSGPKARPITPSGTRSGPTSRPVVGGAGKPGGPTSRPSLAKRQSAIDTGPTSPRPVPRPSLAKRQSAAAGMQTTPQAVADGARNVGEIPSARTEYNFSPEVSTAATVPSGPTSRPKIEKKKPKAKPTKFSRGNAHGTRTFRQGSDI